MSHVSSTRGGGDGPRAAGPNLDEAAQSALGCLAVGREDEVLILCNPPTRTIADALAGAASCATEKVCLLEYPTLSRDGEKPPASVAAAMLRSSVIFAPTVFSISHTEARAAATRAGARIATMGGIDVDVFCRAIAVDYEELKRAGRSVAQALTQASACHVRSQAGTDLRLTLAGRTGISDDGDLRGRAEWGNLPAGEGFIAPVESDGEGITVFDGSFAGFGLLREPVELRLEEGRAVEASGPAGRWLLEALDAGGPTGRLVAELGIGTNPAAIVGGNTLEDEKAIDTAHIAFGTSVSIGGENESNVHIDGVIRAPDVDLDGRPLLRHGTLVEGL